MSGPAARGAPPPHDLSPAFASGATVESACGRFAVEVRDVARLSIASGRLVACDPLAMPDHPAFARTFPVGEHPVSLSIAHLEGGDQRVALASVRFADRPVARWENALLEGDEPLPEGELAGYGVDSGTAAFLDADVASALVKDEPRALSDRLLASLRETYVPTWSWAALAADPKRGTGCVAFSSGFGDGAYPSFLGFDASGELCVLATDFGLLAREVDA